MKHQAYLNMEFNIGINVQVPEEFFDELFTHFGFQFKYVYGTRGHTYILLDVLLCSIAEYFYELCRILASP